MVARWPLLLGGILALVMGLSLLSTGEVRYSSCGLTEVDCQTAGPILTDRTLGPFLILVGLVLIAVGLAKGRG